MPVESVKWGPGRKDEFTAWIHAELIDAKSVHDGLVNIWIKWLEQYRAAAVQPKKNFPYEGASNVMLPMMATDADQLFAKFIQTIHASENVWTTQPLNERWVNASKPLQDFLTWLDGAILNMPEVNTKVFLEMVKLGTGIYKTGWLHEQKTFMGYDKGKAVKQLKKVGKPFVDHVKLADFVLPPNALDIDPDAQGGAPWVAERLRIRIAQLREWVNSQAPLLPNLDRDAIERIIRYEEKDIPEYDAAVQRQDYEKRGMGATGLDWETESPPQHVSGGTTGTTRLLKEVEIWEIHARFPTTSGVNQDDIIVWYHRPTREIIRNVYNYYHHGKRPYEKVTYFPGEGFYGIGVCEQTEVFQGMASDMFNFTWDNVVLTNSRGIVTNAGQNIQPGEPVYPWKIWVVDGPVNQAFSSFELAAPNASLPMLASDIRQMKDRRNGIGDIQLGQIESLPGRTPAMTMQSLLQEGNRRPDLTIKRMRMGLGKVGLRLLQLCQQFMNSDEGDVGGAALLQTAVQMLGQPEGAEVAKMLGNPSESVEFGLGVTIAATSGSANKETAKQEYLSLIQLSGQVAQQIIQFEQVAMQFQGTPIAETASYATAGLLELMKRLLEQYDIKNIDAIIPDVSGQAALASQPQGQQAPGAPGQAGVPGAPQPLYGPVGAPPVAPAGPGLAALSTGLR